MTGYGFCTPLSRATKKRPHTVGARTMFVEWMNERHAFLNLSAFARSLASTSTVHSKPDTHIYSIPFSTGTGSKTEISIKEDLKEKGHRVHGNYGSDAGTNIWQEERIFLGPNRDLSWISNLEWGGVIRMSPIFSSWALHPSLFPPSLHLSEHCSCSGDQPSLLPPSWGQGWSTQVPQIPLPQQKSWEPSSPQHALGSRCTLKAIHGTENRNYYLGCEMEVFLLKCVFGARSHGFPISAAGPCVGDTDPHSQCLAKARAVTHPIPGQLLAEMVTCGLLPGHKRVKGTAHLCWGLTGFPSSRLFPARNPVGNGSRQRSRTWALEQDSSSSSVY